MNPDVINKICKEDRTLAEKIVDFIKELIAKIEELYMGYSAKSVEARVLKENMDTFNEALGLWMDAMTNENDILSDTETKYSLNSNYEEEVDAWFTNENEFNKGGGFFYVGRTSNALKSIGVKDYDVTWDKSKIKKIMNDHKEMTIDVIKKVPNVIENPVIIMQSKTVLDSITLLGEVYDADNKPVMVAMALNPKSRKGKILEYSKITSAYVRTNIQNLIDTSDILYVDENKNRTNNWLSATGLQLPLGLTKYGSIGRVTYYKDIVKNDNDLSFRSFIHRILRSSVS